MRLCAAAYRSLRRLCEGLGKRKARREFTAAATAAFALDIAGLLTEGKNRIVILAEDDTRNPLQPSGKQSQRYASYGCFYTRTTGIWQTVWLEFLPAVHIKDFRVECDVDRCAVFITGTTSGCGTVSAAASYRGKPCGTAECAAAGTFALTLPLSELHLWEAGQGRLYDLTLTVGEDVLYSYFGMRTLGFDGKKIPAEREAGFSAACAGSGLLSGRHLHRAFRRRLVRDIRDFS